MGRNIEAIIVDGVRYDKVRSKADFVCEECELREVCEEGCGFFEMACDHIAGWKECWKRKNE